MGKYIEGLQCTSPQKAINYYEKALTKTLMSLRGVVVPGYTSCISLHGVVVPGYTSCISLHGVVVPGYTSCISLHGVVVPGYTSCICKFSFSEPIVHARIDFDKLDLQNLTKSVV